MPLFSNRPVGRFLALALLPVVFALGLGACGPVYRGSRGAQARWAGAGSAAAPLGLAVAPRLSVRSTDPGRRTTP